MGLLSRAEYLANLVNGASQSTSKKIKISKKTLNLLKKKISEYQKVYRIFGCILLESRVHNKGKMEFCEKLTRVAGDIGIANPISHDLALFLLPSEMDRELIAHRLSKSLNAEPVLSFKAANPEYAINRIIAMS